MSEKYIDILKKYLKKNDRKAIGYSEEELTKIEKLYDIELKGDFREFMKFAGRCDGALLDDDPIILYRQLWEIGSYLWMNYWKFKDKDFPVLQTELKNKPFIFSIEMENYYYYIRTADEDLRVYCFDENEEVIEDTGLNFNEYMLGLVKVHNPELEPALEKASIGELLIQCDTREKRITGLKELQEYMLLEKKEKSELLVILEKYLEKNKKEFIGYNDDELRGIEELYYIKIKGDFKEFLSLGGKSLGGLLGEDSLIFYNNWSIRESVLLQYNIEDYSLPGKDFFAIRVKEKSEFFFIATRDEDFKIYQYNKEKEELKETGMDFNEYMVYLIKRHNPELKELQGVSISGDIINI